MNGTNIVLTQYKEIGYYQGLKLSSKDLQIVKEIVIENWRAQIFHKYPELATAIAIAENGIEGYHQYANIIDHKKLWPKLNRFFNEEQVKQVKDCNFFQKLTEIFGQFRISNEDKRFPEEIYWRLVRPNMKSDVGPIHADEWFWNLGNIRIDNSLERIKVWIPLYCEKSLNGLFVIPRSHLKDYSYASEKRDGRLKPLPKFSIGNDELQLCSTSPGDAIIFHDKLLHGGAIGGAKTRVSIEFTMLVKKSNL